MASPIKRKLVAILAADAVGFSRQMGMDEERTARVLAAHRAVIDGIIAFHDGRIVGTAGDSVLAEFASPVEALRCAVEVQDAIKTRNDSLPERDRMQFRIGVNVGDVMVKGDDLLGDGVNVAARLEGIAEPGGICISSSVYDQIAGKLDLGFVEMGEKQLKNIPRPVRVYRVSGSARHAGERPVAERKRGLPYLAAGALALAAVAAAAWFGAVRVKDVPPIAGVAMKPAPAEAAAPAAIAPAAPVAAPQPGSSVAPEEAAKAQAEALKGQAALELAKVRAEAEVARARAEVAALRRQAAADLAAARAQPRVAETRAPAPSAPPDPVLARPPESPAPVASAPAMPRGEPPVLAAASVQSPAQVPPAQDAAGPWSAKRSCEPIASMPSLTDDVPVVRTADEFVLEKGSSGQPGYFMVRGKPAAEGRLTLSGHIVSGMPQARGREVPAQFEGRVEAQAFELKGRMGMRACTLSFSRRPP